MKGKPMERKYALLCCRCQHRVDFFETGIRPRYECGDPTHNKFACYMFHPILPIAMNVLATEPAWRKKLRGSMMMIRPRETGTVLNAGKFKLCAYETKQGVITYWKPIKHKKVQNIAQC